MKIIPIDVLNAPFEIFDAPFAESDTKWLAWLREAHARLRPGLQAAGIESVTVTYALNMMEFEVSPAVCCDFQGVPVSPASISQELLDVDFFEPLTTLLIDDFQGNNIEGALMWHVNTDEVYVTSLIAKAQSDTVRDSDGTSKVEGTEAPDDDEA